MTRVSILIFATALAASAAQFALRDNGKGIEVTENGKPVLTYNYAMMLASGAAADRTRCCYVSPVYTPAGTIVTDDFPKDHPHHRGIFWAWPVVEVDGKKTDLWTIKGILAHFEQWTKRDVSSPNSAVLAMREGWYMGDRKVVEGDIEITIHAARGNARDIDFKLQFRAVNGAKVSLAGSPDPNQGVTKGYGGFDFRFAPRTGTVINTATLADTPDSDMAPNAWAEFTANYAGGRASVRITGDRENPGFPEGWCLRHYGFIGANNPGTKSWDLAKPLALQYHVTIADEPAPTAKKAVLVYTRNGKGYVHENIAASVAAIKKMGAENGFIVDATDDTNLITDEGLSRYSVIVFSNSNNEAFTNERQRAAFQRFIESGGGFVGIHSASGSERQWPFYWRLIGGTFVSHPKLQKFHLTVADPANPATKHLGAEFDWEDECYFHEFLNPRIHALLTVDPTKLTDPDRVKTGRTGDLFGHAMPLSWTLESNGSSRFYTALGHKKEDYANPVLYRHILGGIQWVLDKTERKIQ